MAGTCGHASRAPTRGSRRASTFRWTGRLAPGLPSRIDGDGERPSFARVSVKRPAFLTAEWRDLAMLNYEIDPAVLEHLVPSGTELDSWESRTLVSVVGFRFLDTRVRG